MYLHSIFLLTPVPCVKYYSYFRKEVLEPCGIYVDNSEWESAVSSPRNVTRNFKMPGWEEWTERQQAQFREICGEEMEKCGYEF